MELESEGGKGREGSVRECEGDRWERERVRGPGREGSVGTREE